MKSKLMRLLSSLLVLIMVGTMFPVVGATQTTEESAAFTQEDYASADMIYDQLTEMEESPAKKSATEAQITDAAIAIVSTSDNFVPGSVVRNGNSFTWLTEDGLRCLYSPRLRQIHKDMVAPETSADYIYNEPTATRGGWPAGNQVYLIGPYYGEDSTFTDQYKNEAKSIASAIGDTDGYTLYSGKSCTLDKVAEAVSNGAVVIFDSHGTTDYENGYDCVTGATSSYLCLTSTTGLTQQDREDGALYYSDGICINGATIANHMTKKSPGGILWMAICLGMATDTICAPMREMGVEVVYGYSQSVTFDGDYCYEETFWDNMIAGQNVAQSVSAMKTKWGNWDGSTQIGQANGWASNEICTSISEAREYYYAFPIVVSDEDVHPGQRSGSSFYGADSLQTVRSTYTLYSQYNVTATSNNTSYGTVSVSGNIITASPKTGYFAQSATVLTGKATVTQNGNTFTVMAESDCTVQVTFAPKTQVTVSFSGANVSSQTGYAGDLMTLPTPTAPEGFTFLGWMNTPLAEDTTEKPAYFDSFTPTGSTTVYALYSYVDETTGSGTGDYVKVTATPADWSGEYLIVYEADAYIFDSTLAKLDAVSNYQEVTISNNTIPAAQGDAYKFTIAATDGGYSIQAANGMYIGQGSNANGLTENAAAQKNTISMDSEDNVNIVSAGGAYLRFNNTSGQYRFRYYKSSTYSNQQPIALYLKDGSAGVTYYTGSPVKCEHANTTNTAAVAATCTQSGYTAGVYCNDCKTYISGHQVVDALGHSWGNWNTTTAPTCENPGTQTHTCETCGASETQSVAATGHSYASVVTPPTATEQGYTTYTCSACGHSYTGDYVDPLGYTYTVKFSVPAEVSSIADMTCGKAGITLPTAAAPTGYTFAGWSTTSVEDTTTAPTLYKAGSAYNTSANTTLYAVYTYSVGGSGTAEYVLTDLADITAEDVFVVTMTYGSTTYALPNNGGTNIPAAPTVTVNGDKLSSAPATSLLWNLTGSASGYTFYPNGSTVTWLYCTNANKGVKIGTDSAKTFVLDSASGYLKHTGTGRYLGVYRTNPDWRCDTSPTTNINAQTLGFYVQTAAGTIHYTSLKAAEPVCQIGTTTYTSFEDALAVCAAGEFVKLLTDLEVEVILEKDLYIDLNGYDLTGLLDPDGYAIYGMDTTTDGYNGDNTGIFNCTDVNDQTVTPVTIHKFEGKRYMTIEETNGYSFHRFYLGITHATVKPSTDGVGYKAMFCGDDAVKAQIATFGYSLQLGTENTPVTVTKSGSEFVSGNAVTLRVDKFDAKKYGEEDLTAKVTITLTDDTVIESAAISMSLRDIVEQACAANLTADQLAALKEMISRNPVMETWNIGNI